MAQDSKARSFFLLNLKVLKVSSLGVEDKNFTKLPTVSLRIKPTSVMNFESKDFLPYTPEYTIVKSDKSMNFVEINGLEMIFSP